MRIFTIETETNNIIVHDTIQEAKAVTNAEPFRNEAGLNKLAADWPATRLVEIWNSLPGVSPVKKFKDHKTAVSRIWKALQSLGQAAPVADEQSSAAEAAPIREANETTEPATAIPEEPERAMSTPSRHRRATLRRRRSPRRRRPPPARARPRPPSRRRPSRPAKAARLPRWLRCWAARTALRSVSEGYRRIQALGNLQ